MALVEMVMPKMGESIMEGTILNWLKQVGDTIQQDESVLEVATDKVDTEVPAPYAGVLQEILAKKGEVVQVGKPIAIINDGLESTKSGVIANSHLVINSPQIEASKNADFSPKPIENNLSTTTHSNGNSKFYSPLVLNIAREEQIPISELEQINGTGRDSRVTKNDILNYINQRKLLVEKPKIEFQNTPNEFNTSVPPKEPVKPSTSISGKHDIIEMDRMRKMIAERMLDSQRISAHVTSFVEADVTNLVYWRNRVKQEFMQKEGLALTFTPIFIEAVVKALKDYPLMNSSVDGDKIIVKKDINIGVAVALANNNLIVPVIKNADEMNIVGLTKKVNDIAKRARANKISPEELQGGTYTISNVGSFGNVMGTPILVQPQVGILALGTVVKKPAVIETEQGDTLGIRHMMFLSHSYDHRIIDGALGGMFVRKVADYLEQFDLSRKVF
ncbi:MAG: 2-oxo acid dehydrogenase subunit E2 [Cytophagales bacterium]|nr:MAG: 2-oxo acid dehydrogenase subunit E2 [Cytophagales bacterium]